jgi:hypothetical protein
MVKYSIYYSKIRLNNLENDYIMFSVAIREFKEVTS